MTKFAGVKPFNGWIANVNVPGGNVERLEGVFGFASDAAVCRNYWLAHWDMGGAEDYNRRNNKFNEIPASEMHHD